MIGSRGKKAISESSNGHQERRRTMTNDQTAGQRTVADIQKEEIRKILFSNKIKNDDLQKIIALANLIGGPDGDDAITETMYAYVTGIANWQEDYDQFFSRPTRSQ
jgi:hypothetical protein